MCWGMNDVIAFSTVRSAQLKVDCDMSDWLKVIAVIVQGSDIGVQLSFIEVQDTCVYTPVKECGQMWPRPPLNVVSD